MTTGEKIKSMIAKYQDQADYLEVRLEDSRYASIEVIKMEVESLNTDFVYGGNVRVQYQGGWGFVVFQSLEGLEEAVKQAISQARLVGKGENHLAEVKPVEDVVELSFINDPRSVTLEEKIKLLKGYNALALDYHQKIVTATARYNENFKKTTFASSEGSYIVQETADINMMVVVTAVEGQNTQTAFYTGGNLSDFDAFRGLEEIVKEKSQLAVDLLEAPRIKGGRYPVILNPHLTGVFTHEAFGHTVEADFIADNPDMQEALKPGRKFGPEFLNIYDSGLIPGLRGSYRYDDEGTPARKTYLLKEGKLTGYLHSRETAAKLNARPTGNARAISYRYPPIVRMTNTAIEGGEASFEEMIADIETGVYAIDPRGGRGGENFSFTASHGYMIRNGELAELIQGFTLTGNLFKTLKNIEMIGRDESLHNSGGGCGKDEQMGLPVTDGGPHIKIQNVTIGGEE